MDSRDYIAAFRGWGRFSVSLTLVVLLLALFPGSKCEAVIALDASTASNYTSLMLGGPSDPVADNQANRADLELVGRPENGLEAFYVGFDDFGSSSTTDGDWYFRVRVSGENGNPDGVLNGFVYVGLDITGDGTLDYLIEHGGNPNQTISIRRPGGASNDTNSVSQGTALYTTDVVRLGNEGAGEVANSFFETVEIIDPGLVGDGTYDPYDLDDGGNKNGDLDRFLTFSLDFQEFVDIVRADAVDPSVPDIDAGYQLFDDTFALQMLVVTSQNSNNINSDFGGVNDDDDASGTPFTEVVTGPVDPGGGSIPEPAGYALLLGAATVGLIIGRRRRR